MLDEFIKGYIDAMNFTETGEEEDGKIPFIEEYEFSDELKKQIDEDCAAFYLTAAGDNDEPVSGNWFWQTEDNYGDYNAGIDFWLSRNGHGAGFFGRNIRHADYLQELARVYGEVNVYLGEDNLLYS